MRGPGCAAGILNPAPRVRLSAAGGCGFPGLPGLPQGCCLPQQDVGPSLAAPRCPRPSWPPGGSGWLGSTSGETEVLPKAPGRLPEDGAEASWTSRPGGQIPQGDLGGGR